MAYVIDASAVIALLRDEPGAERVAELLASADSSAASAAFISTVNLAELHRKLGADLPDPLVGGADSLITSSDFTRQHAKVAGAMYELTERAGLSLADRSCLALAQTMELPVITADRAWAKVSIGVELELIR